MEKSAIILDTNQQVKQAFSEEEKCLVDLLSGIVVDSAIKTAYENEKSNQVPAHKHRSSKQLQHIRSGSTNKSLV